jgi:hypothetical protein
MEKILIILRNRKKIDYKKMILRMSFLLFKLDKKIKKTSFKLKIKSL